MQNNLPLVLDVCCSTKGFWFDVQYPNAIYCDKRSEIVEIKPRKAYPNGGSFEVRPDIQCSFTALPFASDMFSIVVFDPPHASFGKTSYQRPYYGSLDGNWREMLRDGFSECFRVLKPEGVLIFKWNETQYSVKDILALTPNQPMFGHKSGKQMKTHWITFTKPNNRMHLTAFGAGTAAVNPLQSSMFAEVSPATIGGR